MVPRLVGAFVLPFKRSGFDSPCVHLSVEMVNMAWEIVNMCIVMIWRDDPTHPPGFG